jgi:hypothetical protein
MDQNQESLLLLISRTLKFATDHPYAATGLFGAAIGSVATYKLLTFSAVHQSVNTVLNHKVYECIIPAEDLQRLLKDPEYELRWEMTDTSVIVTAEKREQLKALPDIEYKGES